MSDDPKLLAMKVASAASSAIELDEIGILPAITRPMTLEGREKVIKALARLVTAHLEREAIRQGSLSYARSTVGQDPTKEAQAS